MFGANQSGGAPDLIVTSSNSGLQGQEGLDRTAMDIQVRIRNIGKYSVICCDHRCLPEEESVRRVRAGLRPRWR